MTHKDYILIAQALADAYRFNHATASTRQVTTEPRFERNCGIDLAARELAAALAAENPRFDKERFLEAATATSHLATD